MKKTKYDIAIVILNWNGVNDTRACLQSLKQQEGASFHVIVVDNASLDDSVDALHREFSDIEIIQSERNLGFAGGNNLGLEKAMKLPAETVMILNNDTWLDSKALRMMLDCLRADRRIGAVVPKIAYYHDPDTLWYAGGEIRWWKVSVSHYGFRKKDHGQFDVEKNVSFASGCCVLFRKEALEQVGLFDSRYFLYFEDVDLSYRLISSGYWIRYCPRAFILHKVGAGSNRDHYSARYLYYQTRNRFLAFSNKKHIIYRLFVLIAHFAVYCCLRSFLLFLSSSKNKSLKIYAIVTGFVDSLAKRYGITNRKVFR